MSGDALRFDQDKIKLNLIPPYSIEQIGKVFTSGAVKYGDNNWQKGMKWSKVIGSLKRHLLKFESGEDFDEETGIYHLAHLVTNAMFLMEYYKIYPQGDDRPHKYLNSPKIGVGFIFFGAVQFRDIYYIIDIEECDGTMIITDSLKMYECETKEEKFNIAKELEIDIFIDTSFETFKYFNKSGICCYLFHTENNEQYDVGYKRICNLNDFLKKINKN